MMSTRRSAASSSRTITQLNSGAVSSGPSSFPVSSPSIHRTPPQPTVSQSDISSSDSGRALTEAGAYARAMTSTLTRSQSAQHTTGLSTISNQSETSSDPAGRPLPRPPGQSDYITRSVPRAAEPKFQPATRSQLTPTEMAVPTPPTASSRSAKSSPSKTTPKPQSYAVQSPSGDQKNIRAPLPQVRRSDTAGPAQPAGASSSRVQGTNQSDNQSDDPMLRLAAQQRYPSVLQRPTGRLQLDFLLAHPAIQSSLLGAIGINTFLSLSGSSENVRRQFTGESVGRWVLGEWTVNAPNQEGNRWPNLTVWEGFRT